MISSLSLVIPAYNEEANLAQTILAAEPVLRNHVAKQLEWLLVDDGSSDGTWAEMADLAKSMSGIVPLQHQWNRGLGAAIWTGMKEASMTWCTWMPADGQIDPQSYADMVELAGESDVVLLMREEAKRPFWRQILTLILYGSLRLLFGFDPYGFSGVYLVPKEILSGIPACSTTAVQNYAVAIHCHKNGYRIQQVRTAIRPRLSGKSKVANLPTMVKVLYDLLRLWHKL